MDEHQPSAGIATARTASLYVYAVLRPGLGDPRPAGPIQLVECGGMHVAVRAVDAPPVVDAAGLQAHDVTVRALHEQAVSLLPMRFGTMVPDEAALRAWIDTVRPILERGLDLVRDREQMVIRIYGDAALLSASRPPDEAPGAGTGRGTRYLMQRKPPSLPEALSCAMEGLRRRLLGLVVSERVERHETPPLIATLRHLVPREGSAAYRAAVEHESPAIEGFTLSVSGPWPPYAFTPEELS
jgi:gas vesicle protein GvpL/GvpF